jgi:tetratricopeptide (TPR) repeat protein
MTASALLNQAAAHHRQGRWEAALAAYEQALATGIGPTAPLLETIAAAAWASGRAEEALRRLRQALALGPAQALVHRNLGIAATDDGSIADGVRRQRRAATCDPFSPLVWEGLASAYRDASGLAAAAQSWRRSLVLAPNSATGWYDLGTGEQQAGHWSMAMALLRRALAIEPRHAPTLGNLAVCLSEQNRTEEALSTFEQAVRCDPSSFRRRHALHLERLKAGLFEDAWEAIADTALPAPENLRCRAVLLSGTSGFGDVIQFLRYVPLVAALAKSVALTVPIPLIAVVRRAVGGVPVAGEGLEPPPHEVALRLLDLPNVFRTTATTIPAPLAIAADTARSARWRDRITRGRRPAVGVVWAGDPAYPMDWLRSPGFGPVLPLLASDVAHFHVLQVGSGRAELGTVTLPPGVIDLGGDIGDFDDTAAIVDGLDLVITSCTAAAHLAGSMGRPTWVMLRHASDWRWMLGRSDSPWYPGMRLFRQATPGDWAGVVAEVMAALRERYG